MTNAETREGSGVEGHAEDSGLPAPVRRPASPEAKRVNEYRGLEQTQAGVEPGLPSLVSACNGPTGPCVLEIGHPGDHQRAQMGTANCSKCERPIWSDYAPAIDYKTGLPVCDDCTRVQRHVRRSA